MSLGLYFAGNVARGWQTRGFDFNENSRSTSLYSAVSDIGFATWKVMLFSPIDIIRYFTVRSIRLLAFHYVFVLVCMIERKAGPCSKITMHLYISCLS